MLYAGIDIGSLTGKAVIMKDDDLISSSIIQVKRNPVLTSELVYTDALSKTGFTPDEIDYCVGTGYGRERIPYINKSLSEISCHGRGAFFLNNAIRSIIDVGGQDCKVISIDEYGELVDFRMNEKCAAGTGRYLEIMADLLGLALPELGAISLKSKTPISLSSECSIYAQSEVLNYISRKIKKADIAAGINHAMAQRVHKMTEKINLQPKFTITGGVAKNVGVVKALERLMKVEFQSLSIDSQLIGALGAAIFAKSYW
ncbi:MAG: 2-hydroxyglutaryl-CoA dehydratase [Candidatus Lokiarchaeota archaeon]|nr:2-hydroxyglutaryl-CoA dehydratase [Candidatus Lokiarchaeota archaeon]